MNMENVTEHYAHYVQLLTCVLCYISVLISIDLFIIVHHVLSVKYLEQLVSQMTIGPKLVSYCTLHSDVH